MSRSLIVERHAVVRMIATDYLRGRRLDRHGQHRGLVPLPLADALRLVEKGTAKLPAGQTLRQLREAVAAHEALA